jgi:hypothetical protein
MKENSCAFSVYIQYAVMVLEKLIFESGKILAVFVLPPKAPGVQKFTIYVPPGPKVFHTVSNLNRIGVVVNKKLKMLNGEHI